MAANAMEKADVTAETMLPDLFARHPQSRAVFDRYGLHGCGGRGGPVESIGFFCRSHGVPLEQLLREVQQAIGATVPDPAAAQASVAAADVADTIYRPFFTAGIATILTVGASWGALLLWRIGLAGSFTGGPSVHEINAHGHAQIFGWVGLFIMGFAYQAFPRMWHTTLAAPRLAAAAFWMMLTGIVARTVSMALTGAWDGAVPVTLAAGALEVAAVLIFVGQILVTFVRSGAKVEPYVVFAVTSMAFFVLQAVASLWHSYNTMTAATREELLWYVATYQAPLRDLQIHGLALFMILGVSIRMVPALFEVPEVPARRAWTAYGLLLAAVVLEIGLFISYRWTDNHALAAGLLLPWHFLLIGASMVALRWKLWRPLPVADRSGKFIRAAYGWLAVSLVMLLMLPIHQKVSGITFSHAYYGAIRHAITVGFISLMIMGFAAKVVPTLNGMDPARLSRLIGPFVLVNVGCFLRVSTQIATDWHNGAFAVVGISGMLEVTGLGWWGVGLIRIMRQGKREMAALAAEADREHLLATRPPHIVEDHRVADVLVWFPQTEEIFYRHGFTPLKNPLLRRTLARRVTLRQAAKLHGVAVDEFVRDLNAAAADEMLTGR